MLSEAMCPKSGKKISGIAIDSRQVHPGDLFFALPGAITDGHQFLAEAAKAGAIAAVVSKEYQGKDFGLELVVVEDPKKALQEAGRNQYNLFQGSIIGITGSLGKTTTKEFSKTLLASSFKVHASPKSYNSQLTVPLSLLMADGDEDLIILEMGVSEPGNMENLLSIVQPDISVITQVNSQHALHFPTGIEGILQEKSQILEKSQIQFLPKDSPWYPDLLKRSVSAEKFSFSFHDTSADFYYKTIRANTIVIQTPEGDYDLPISFPYKPAYINLLIAVAFAWLFDVSLDSLIHSLPNLQLPPMRFEQNMKNGVQVINDVYNACPEAMLAALDALPTPYEGGKIILVLGHMSELGMYSKEGHCIVAKKALAKAQKIFFIGEYWAPIQPIVQDYTCDVDFYPSAQDVKDVLKSVIQQGDVILLKGARALALESLLSCF
ncbi:UDP-N-acetylmuramoylalanyl-D-glutamyl-2,6- diaminopimelate--D-alanyl-D-alanine ligase [Candidatus Chlamydia sanziniae]|uniref:UDP-N-acetylmuramoyl-tripeptide--D-alanyl-D-alanine ligase n=2 Tax=Candidatus Chlamydia sanziniae TaxID=1806891 RepID=A0A1A9HUM9_9CHLA|nr:UDP-N-acetylmuramoylalanyl-D-glutamyl-2,6- diaminopimelate--D-alanyl-D-alanine ligase [Candidatus Chlamydia sanziniae]